MGNILVIDDDLIIQKTINSALTKEGHTVFTASDGHAALEIVQKEELHLIVCDLNLPMGLPGLKLIKIFRENPEIKNLPMMIVSSRRTEADVLKGIDAGVDDYIIKPIDFDIFTAKVKSLLNRGSHTFTISRVKATGFAAVKTELKIVGISEEGLQFISSHAFEADSKINIESEIYNQIGIGSPLLRIAHVEKLETDDHFYVVKGNFIGLTPGDMQKVRVYINRVRVKPPVEDE